jgi:hypothetical protein
MSYVSESERERFRALLGRAAAEDSRRLHSEPLDDGRAPPGIGLNPRVDGETQGKHADRTAGRSPDSGRRSEGPSQGRTS